MAIKFLEPGGDATFNVATTTSGGFWSQVSGTVNVVTDFVHGNHIKSLQFPSSGGVVTTPNPVLSDSGTRMSLYMYFTAFVSSGLSTFMAPDSTGIFAIRITSTGIIKLYSNNAEIGSGATISLNKWYRISLAYTITDTTHNRFEIFLDGNSIISVTNATLGATGTLTMRIGNVFGDVQVDCRTSDIYIDDSSSLKDTGDIWVTAKRPNANGTLNEFTTQIGISGSGYGTGHSPQVNERALNTANGWSIINAGSIKTEEYTIESASTGDIDISKKAIVGFIGWVYASSVTSETAKIRLVNVDTNIALSNTNTMFTAVAGNNVYPTGGTDIGVVTDATVTTVGLYECGITVAFINSFPSTGILRQGFKNQLRPRAFKPGLAR